MQREREFVMLGVIIEENEAFHYHKAEASETL